MEELVELALLLLTVFFYLYNTLKKNPEEDVLPVPGLPEDVRKGSRKKPSAPSVENERKDLSLENLQVRREKNKQPNKTIRHPLKEVFQQATTEVDDREPDSITIFETLEKQYSAEQRMVIYAEIIKRPDF